MKFSVIPASVTEEKAITVVYLDEKVEVESFPQSFSDFNSWVRSRFGLKITDKISFRNIGGSGELCDLSVMTSSLYSRK